ncbi:hypothetical protein WMY93_024839 [Mugilogobius chulae]|uniref:[histone H3]-trimethyl-L-lysine(9) demethylase n=1 Tax=Mugilogobius chulae TaxID=88201 RepID=A0AAW0N6A6_9GOBI
MATDTGAVGHKIMTFYPTKEEFKDFNRYVAHMESQGAHKAGMAKVIPPKAWKPRQTYDDIDDLVIPAPIQQVVTGQAGLFTLYNIQKKPMTVHEFRKSSNLEKFSPPQHADCDELERKFWKNLTFNPPLYGAEVSGSLYDKVCGAPDQGKRLEALAKGFFPGSSQSCDAFLRHKMTLVSPAILKKYDIPFEKVTQHKGQFIVTFPYAYHAGFNHGFNCAESSSFATLRWIDYGKQATQVTVRLSAGYGEDPMDVFVRKYQPERYKLWKTGKDTAPIDHSKATPEWEPLRAHKETKKKKTQPAPAAPLSKPDENSKAKPIKLEVVESGKPEIMDTEETRKPHKTKTPRKISPKKEKGTAEEKSEPKQEKDVKPPSKSPGQKKSSNRRSPIKKEKIQAEVPERSVREPADTELTSASSEGAESAVTSPHAKVFQRTLSPADVLHVHSYAKGDYSEEEGAPMEERKSDVTNSGAVEEADSGPQSQAVEEMAVDVVKPESDLDRLPGHHPLIKEGVSDGEVTEEMTPVNEAGLEGESWAKPLAHLWQSRPPNAKKEREYNLHMGSKPPYCCICALFHTYHQTEVASSVNSPVVLPGDKMRTKPLIPESCFSINTEEDSDDERSRSTAYVEEDGTSLLINCSECCVRVHASCYGVDPASVDSEWKCARCKANAFTENCCLCSLRGGALQKANNNKWVHVLCAVAVLEARFVNITDRCPVDLSGIPLQRFKLKCYYCKKRMKKAWGCCVQCSHGRCPTAYHPTCAQAAGVLMQPDHWPFVVHVTCCRHKGPTQIERNKAAMHKLTVGQRVICKHKNGRYYQCDVVQLSTETFYEVNFDDGSFSDNLFPEDIVSRDCVQLGPPLRVRRCRCAGQTAWFTEPSLWRLISSKCTWWSLKTGHSSQPREMTCTLWTRSSPKESNLDCPKPRTCVLTASLRRRRSFRSPRDRE